jgi:hypothetical protein
VGGLRQSFLRDGQLVMSRLVPLGAAQDTLDGARVETELARLRQYLERSGLCAPDETPAVVVLTAEGRHAASANEAAQAWRYVAVDALLGARGPRQIDDCDALFAALLCRAPPATQYASPAQTAVHRGRRRTRLALSAMALGLCLAAGAGLWQTLEGLQLAARAAALAARNGETQASLIISRAAVPPVLMPSAQLRPAVDIAAAGLFFDVFDVRGEGALDVLAFSRLVLHCGRLKALKMRRRGPPPGAGAPSPSLASARPPAPSAMGSQPPSKNFSAQAAR